VHCAANYYQSQSYICAKCPANCATCSNAQTCATCMMYYFLDTDNKCQLCPTNCKNCTNATTCNAAQCIDGYFLSAGLCHKCAFGCQSCTNGLDCNTCTAGYYLTTENTCYPCWSNMPGCLTCSDHKTCLTCDTEKYYKMNYGNVVSCITIDSGCEDGATADDLGCSKCKLGSYLVGNRCKVAPSGCALTNVSSACLHCHDGYYLQGGNTCALCDRVYPGCMKCDTDATTCRVCNKGFRLQGSKCELCPLDCNYCQTTDKFTCDECRPGYWPKRETISSQVWITC
jgi:proprotein convertase subtilisin/kexin type 5